ncbi:hypothetical protein [Rhodococcus pyridinivorans]|uniref:Uncharacterized protein n=1 Tax=Rhodococcus pyridinivorans AK37 TaxID=1114960 RepID=H0JL79_9NOCA|nr:hypothetical protein [Rhodococcus pyridinivorans]EHK86414.1 hypothetical protein AK37_01662 [Rhodococcus pyridinivorans AK37]MCD2139494.1 hypothetical protein [Rhodococcus pyridinivorans]
MITFLFGFVTAFAVSGIAAVAFGLHLRHKSESSEFTEEDAQATAEELLAELGDSIRYAGAILTIGYHPDDPESIVIQGHVGPGRTLCDRCVGESLAQTAQRLLERTPHHRTGGQR